MKQYYLLVKSYLIKKYYIQNNAIELTPMSYPNGDINQKIGVCTDIIIRALRPLGIDLQALLHEDISLNPKRYSNIRKGNYNIDHRRTRNLKTWLDHYAIKLDSSPPTISNFLSSSNCDNNWKPGDIVIFDTGVNNGTQYDHIGIVSDNMILGNQDLLLSIFGI